jgi:2-hydroxychromene-2-carboxylate isomerase
MTFKEWVLDSQHESGRTRPRTIRGRITIYGSFDDPWSYLASRRADLLRRDGVHVDWRAVEAADRREARAAGQQARLHRVRAQLDQVVTELLPGERLPYSFTGFVPETTAAVLEYADAYRAGVGTAIRTALFEALWWRGFDVGDAELVQKLATRAWSGPRPCDRPEDAARQLRQLWRDELSVLGNDLLPVLVVDGRARLHGCHAAGWLGDEMMRRGVDPKSSSTASGGSDRRYG